MIDIDISVRILIITDNAQEWINYIKNNILNTRCIKSYNDDSYQIISPMFKFDISDNIDSYWRNRYSTIVVDKVLPNECDNLSEMLSVYPIKYTTNYKYLWLRENSTEGDNI